ncbi:hypothetical protein QTP88_012948 [Uroleucon formosanum]
MCPFPPIRSASRADVTAFPRLSAIYVTVTCIYTQYESHAGFSAQLAYRLYDDDVVIVVVVIVPTSRSSELYTYYYIYLCACDWCSAQTLKHKTRKNASPYSDFFRAYLINIMLNQTVICRLFFNSSYRTFDNRISFRFALSPGRFPILEMSRYDVHVSMHYTQTMPTAQPYPDKVENLQFELSIVSYILLYYDISPYTHAYYYISRPCPVVQYIPILRPSKSRRRGNNKVLSKTYSKVSNFNHTYRVECWGSPYII